MMIYGNVYPTARADTSSERHSQTSAWVSQGEETEKMSHQKTDVHSDKPTFTSVFEPGKDNGQYTRKLNNVGWRKFSCLSLIIKSTISEKREEVCFISPGSMPLCI